MTDTNTDNTNEKAEINRTIELVAGYKTDNEPVLEQIVVQAAKQPGEFVLTKSPAFVRGLAAGDLIRYPAETELGYELLQHSGNLSVRVLHKHNTEALAQALTPEMELRDGCLDVQSPKLLVYTIHVSIGFQRIEELMDSTMGRFTDCVWYYGNVYDPADGVTPLNWWQDLAREV